MNFNLPELEFRTQKCTYCGSDCTMAVFQDQFAYHGRRFWQWACSECGIWFSPAEDGLLVDNDDYFEHLANESTESVNYRYKLLKPYLRENQKILEVGFGTGGLMSFIKERHPSVRIAGLDNSQKLVQEACSKGLHCFSNVEELDFETDFIYANHVFEHFDHPQHFFSLLEKVKKAGLTVLLTFPNRDNYWIRRGLFPVLHLPQHRFYFSLGQVQRFFEEKGFIVCESKTLESPERVRENLKNSTYNKLRGNLEIFKNCYPKEEKEWSKLLSLVDFAGVAENICRLELGSEGFLVADLT